MRTLLVLLTLGAVIWYGWQQHSIPTDTASQDLSVPTQSLVKETASRTEPIAYKKCTTADGSVLFGEVPTGVNCIKKENIRSAITLLPSTPTQLSGTGRSSMAVGTSSQDQNSSSSPQKFACDGRTHCSQMRSCDEAKYFLSHCPNMQMDGNNDGIPCRRQWCQ